MCKYCENAVPLMTGKTNDTGVVVKYPNGLMAYGYDIHGMSNNAIIININYCPMCGKKLEE